MPHFDVNKTKIILAYIASKVDVGKTKLMKLFYLIDFLAYEKTGKSITWDEYKHWSLGPVPANIWKGMRGSLADGVLSTSEEETSAGTYLKYSPVTQPDTSSLSPTELAIIDDVVKQYGGLGQRELVDMLHKEAPYLMTVQNETIPYFLACYRKDRSFTKQEMSKIENNKQFIAELKAAHKESQKPEYRPVRTEGVTVQVNNVAIGF